MDKQSGEPKEEVLDAGLAIDDEHFCGAAFSSVIVPLPSTA